MKISHSILGAFAGLMLVAGAAAAQDAPAPQKPPEVKQIGDWTVRCFAIQSPSPCDMYQELDDKASRQRVLSFSIAYVPSMDRHGVQITVPLEISIPKGLVIQTDSFTSPVLKYRRCDRQGCYVEMAMDSASIASLSRSGKDAKVKIVADSGRSFDLKFSLNGFSAAHDYMVEQARTKAKTPAKPATAAAPAAAPAP
jgi:invasion protein IalB